MSKNNELNILSENFTNLLIGDPEIILQKRDNIDNTAKVFHEITIDCTNRVLGIIDKKKIFANYLVDPSSVSHSKFKVIFFKIIKEKFGENHNMFIKFSPVVDEKNKFSIIFSHYKKKDDLQAAMASVWIEHKL